MQKYQERRKRAEQWGERDVSRNGKLEGKQQDEQATVFGGRLSKMCMVDLRPAWISKFRRPGHCPA